MKISLNSKDPSFGLFLAHFPNFWSKKNFFPKTPAPSHKDGQTLFHKILLATSGGLTRTTAVEWHLKVNDIEQDVDLTKNYCIKVSMQKISLIHTLIFKTAHFGVLWNNSKISEMNLSFPEFAPACKKSLHSIYSFLRYSQFQTGHTHFWLCPPKNILISF